MKPKLILMVGNIGSGKSTMVKKLVKRGFYCVSRDSIRMMLNAGKYAFKRKDEYLVTALEQAMLRLLMTLQENIVIDDVNVHRDIRRNWLDMAKTFKYNATAYVMPKLSRRVSVNRRMKDPHGTEPRSTWEYIWTRFDFGYEEPTKKEGFYSIKHHEK
jgi:predicted kinase